MNGLKDILIGLSEYVELLSLGKIEGVFLVLEGAITIIFYNEGPLETWLATS